MTTYTRFPPRADAIPAGADPSATGRDRTRVAGGAPARPSGATSGVTAAAPGWARPPRDGAATGRAQDAGAGGNATGTDARAESGRLPLIVYLFLLSLFLPFGIELSGIYLTPQRIMMLLAAAPVLFRWLRGDAGRHWWTDGVVIATAAWAWLCFTLDGPVSTGSYAILAVIEGIIPFLLARVYMKTLAQYRTMARLFWWMAVILLPGAILEATSGVRIYNDFFAPWFDTYDWADYERRWGLFRAQTVFEHPILFGIFIAMLFSPVYVASRARRSAPASFLATWPLLGCVFLCLSSGAYVAVGAQAALMAWGAALRNVAGRWKLLGGLFVVGYILVDLISTRTPFQVASTYLSIDNQTAYWRVLILEYGMQNVWANPLFGLGLGDWERPDFMAPSSVDNYWLLMAMRYGIPGLLLVLATWVLSISHLARSRITDPEVSLMRDGHAFALLGVAVAIFTVHVWSATYLLMMFFLGCCTMFADTNRAVSGAASDPSGAAGGTASDRSRRAPGHTRAA